MNNYSQAGQDKFVLSLINNQKDSYFFDVGCWLPDNLNNTFLLEKNGWDGLSIDITDLTNEWKSRNTKFVCCDALAIDYQKLFDEHKTPKIIDYLNLDIEGDGSRFEVLDKIFKSDREFKIITIEHDKYRGYQKTEKEPQITLLSSLGYVLVCSDVCLNGNAFEDWWVNPRYIKKEKYEKLICENKEATEIIKML